MRAFLPARLAAGNGITGRGHYRTGLPPEPTTFRGGAKAFSVRCAAIGCAPPRFAPTQRRGQRLACPARRSVRGQHATGAAGRTGPDRPGR
ncbi:hypothetical protein GCM10010420_52560 [Streptomyces glaucosporus]|uniref:Uncharacterized protein n=1 Tax=Streptomyces glaucosporus TaxID=284044 RepID=A0ABN3IY96_9ACTN